MTTQTPKESTYPIAKVSAFLETMAEMLGTKPADIPDASDRDTYDGLQRRIGLLRGQAEQVQEKLDAYRFKNQDYEPMQNTILRQGKRIKDQKEHYEGEIQQYRIEIDFYKEKVRELKRNLSAAKAKNRKR